jgi:hypothetical protein
MKTLLLGSVLIFALISVPFPVFAQEKWTVEREGRDVEMRPQYDYDYSKRYRGTMDADGTVRLRNPQTGDVYRGRINSDGSWYIRDSEGNAVKVSPR